MNRALTLITLLVCPTIAMASNFAECLLDNLPGVQNDATAYAAAQLCTSKYPERYDSIEQGSGRGFFSYESGAECALDKGADTQSSSAAGQIRVACNRLYNPQQTVSSQTSTQPPRKLVPYDGEFTPIKTDAK